MPYLYNTKMLKSGMLAAIPQKGECPNYCKHCFFQSGRSFLEPLDENTPNMPPVEITKNRVIRVNDGNDSNHQRELVMEAVKDYSMKFYNTSIPFNIGNFDAPVVLTVNPGKMTDTGFHKLARIQKNLMFVRIRTNMWNIEDVVKPAVEYYTSREIPVVLTFMAYYEEDGKIPKEIPDRHFASYRYRQRTTNYYHAITTLGWETVMSLFRYNKWVYTCSKIEGELGTSACHRCGNCLREYFYTMEKLRND